MEYRFQNKVRPSDFWILSMRNTYRSLVGVCNIVFTAAMFALTYQYFGKVHDILEVLMFIGCILFPVLQPLLVYMRAKSQASMIPQNLELSFDDRGLLVTLGGQKQEIPWKKMARAIKSYNMVVVYDSKKQGYVISNRMMGKDKEAFWEFVQSNLSKVSK